MSKKVLILSGSPRKGGNSDFLCDAFMKGAQEAGHDVEKIFINDKKISYCRACYVCRHTHKCFQKDDMTEILDKMIEADVLVLASPVYFYAIAGQVKTMLDRTLPRWTELKNKEFYYILT
ncbi:flavodoxin family protein, partial [Selenomonas ruminantium]